MKELSESIFVAVKAVMEEYVFAAEATGKTGEEKKEIVVNAVTAVIVAVGSQFKLNAIVLAVAKFILPYLVDAVVAKFNALGKLSATTATATTTATTTANPTTA
jgi:hypothetical protein